VSAWLNDPARADEIVRLIRRKPALLDWYAHAYHAMARATELAAADGPVIEIGSGAGFAKQVVPDLVTSDVIEYPGVDVVFDGQAMPFRNDTVRAFVMLNTFHHLPDASRFLAEVERCLRAGGRLFMIEPHRGPISSLVLRYGHHEPFDPSAPEWSFASDGPLTGANSALAWIVFRRDVARMRKQNPHLRVEAYRPRWPLQYWLAGGLKWWSLIPRWSIPFARTLDRALLALSPDLGSFAEITVTRGA
jgi:SAM-dependent methyltransferase